MNVIFLTMVQLPSLSGRGIYVDLLRYFSKQGHNVYVVFPQERRLKKTTEAFESDCAHFLGVRTLNLQKSSIIEKGVGQVLVEGQFKRAIRKLWGNENFDLILYSTPPITLMGAVKYLKNRNPQAKSYLLLKDIFPQNAVDIGMMPGKGYRLKVTNYRSWINLFKYHLYKYFRKKEAELYAISDYIGCMSPANVEFVLKNNPEVAPSKVEVAPNSVELNVNDNLCSSMVAGRVSCGARQNDNHNINDNENKVSIRSKYGLPMDKPVFIYGGNLGKPQGIPFLVKCLDAIKNRSDCHFVVVGSGTEQHLIQAWYDKEKPNNTTVLQALPKSDYDTLVNTCDVGLIFLDHRFTIPNFPSRLLSYLENKMPVLCATDPNCDMGTIAEANGFGYWCESNSVEAFTGILDKMIHSDIKAMGEKGYEFLKENYLVEHTYNAIMGHL